LKPILDKSSMREDGVSTLLILSSDEESAAKLARCILGLVNKETKKNQVNLSNIYNKISIDNYFFLDIHRNRSSITSWW
jgi:hypothetical protein